MKTKLTHREILQDFYLVVRYNDVSAILNLFDGNWKDYINAPKNLKDFYALKPSQKDERYEKVFSDINLYNSVSFTKKQMRSFFHSTLWTELIKTDSRIKVQKHGVLSYKNIKTCYSTHYHLSFKELSDIFTSPNSKTIISEILAIENYEPRVQKLILKNLKAETIICENTITTSKGNTYVFKTTTKQFKNIHESKLSEEEKMLHYSEGVKKAKETKATKDINNKHSSSSPSSSSSSLKSQVPQVMPKTLESTISKLKELNCSSKSNISNIDTVFSESDLDELIEGL